MPQLLDSKVENRLTCFLEPVQVVFVSYCFEISIKPCRHPFLALFIRGEECRVFPVFSFLATLCDVTNSVS